MGWTTVLTISAGIFAIPNNAFAQGSSLTIVNCADVDPTHVAAPPQGSPLETAPENSGAPGEGATLNYVVFNNGQMASNGVIPDQNMNNPDGSGWNPDGKTWYFFIRDIDANPNSVVSINVIDQTNWPVCVLNGVIPENVAGASNMTTGASNMTTRASNMTPSNATSQ